jgi:hypothetical protein
MFLQPGLTAFTIFLNCTAVVSLIPRSRYAAFLESSGYTPVDTEHWLQHWGPTELGKPRSMPAELASQPVTFVSIKDAQNYCAHYKLRLPHAWEWQWFAGGSVGDARLYPWGAAPPSNTTCPPISGGVGDNLTTVGPYNVSKYPAGCSPAGVCDLIGNTWEFTDTFTDQHDSAVLLNGGSHYYAKGSMWYFPNVNRIDQHQKAFLLSDGYERAGTVGFRCVGDSSVPPAPPPPDPCHVDCDHCRQKASASDNKPCLCLASGGANCPPKYHSTNGGKRSNQALDLGSAGATDWVATSSKGSVALSRMATPVDPSHTIEFAVHGGNASSYCCSPLGISWSDGAPPNQRKQPAAGDGVCVKKKGGGYSIRSATSAEPQRLTVLAACWSASCTLNATVGSGPGTATHNFEMSVGKEVVTFEFELVFSGGAIEVNWEMTEGGGNIPFQAAFLSSY